MHAASVDPEPGSNSPKERTALRLRLFRGFDRSHIRVFMDLCHSSVVKVQPAPKHARASGAERGVWGLAGGASNGAERAPGAEPSTGRPPSRQGSKDRNLGVGLGRAVAVF